MKWLTEASWFKRLDNPATRIGAMVTAVVAAVFGIWAFVENPNTTNDCATNPLRGVYNPQRLRVIATCQEIPITVEHVVKERDGDLHIRGAADAKWLLPGNSRQYNDLVVEYMPGDPWPKPHDADRLLLTCTWVQDVQHGGLKDGWAECHPVFAVQPLSGTQAIEP